MAEGVSEELDGVTELEDGSGQGVSSEGVSSELGTTLELEEGFSLLEEGVLSLLEDGGSTLLDDAPEDEESPEGPPFESEESLSGTLSGTSDCSSSSSSIRLELSLGFAWKVRVRTDSTKNSSVEPSFMVTLMSLEKEALLPNKREDVSTLAKSLEGISFAMALQAQKTATTTDILISVFILSLQFL